MAELSYEAMYKLRSRAVATGCTEAEMVKRFRLMWEPLGSDWVASKIVWALWQEGLDTPQKVADADLDRLTGIRNLGGKCLLRLGEFRASVKVDGPLELQALGKHIDAARELLERHQRRDHDHADWRVSELTHRLNRAAVLARYLRDGTNPEGDAVREGLLDRLGYPPEGDS